jgi:hypothetical protein
MKELVRVISKKRDQTTTAVNARGYNAMSDAGRLQENSQSGWIWVYLSLPAIALANTTIGQQAASTIIPKATSSDK